MKRALLTAFLAATTCARIPVDAGCVSKCGLRTFENCAELQAYEDKAVKEFEGLGWGSSEKVCALLSGWTVRMHARRHSDFICEEGWYHDEAQFCVLGYTYTETKTVEVFTSDWQASPLAHEFVHALDHTLHGTVGHCGWQIRGIKKALLKIQGRPDPSKPEPTCLLQ